MRIVLLAVGRMKAGPERDLLRRYIDRAEAAARSVGLTGIQMIEIEESRARSSEQRKRDEAIAIRDKLPAGAAVTVLDERGRAVASEALAAEIARARDGGTPAIVFAIGGPDGFDADLLRSHRAMSFGAATFPHQLVRVLMAEQVYRATTILSGHPYHRS